MPKNVVAEPAQDPAWWAVDALSEVMRVDTRLLEQLFAIQSASMVSWWALQAEWMQAWAALGGAADELPTWMIWHNGLEQLA
jgi:hypothetical protein